LKSYVKTLAYLVRRNDEHRDAYTKILELQMAQIAVEQDAYMYDSDFDDIAETGTSKEE